MLGDRQTSPFRASPQSQAIAQGCVSGIVARRPYQTLQTEEPVQYRFETHRRQSISHFRRLEINLSSGVTLHSYNLMHFSNAAHRMTWNWSEQILCLNLNLGKQH
ncbi:hypothetical protein RRG08_015940 [Elysia crispata]|uniref:Uncharacterized protein n=1 Tax=Elysia crispata TaxID=231223 RepID=A0AAE1E152_9GAST|nr:hypothetical protein RRG08_015940 [Elysia crispata]